MKLRLLAKLLSLQKQFHQFTAGSAASDDTSVVVITLKKLYLIKYKLLDS